MFPPSSEWSIEERNEVLKRISKAMQAAARENVLIRSADVYDWGVIIEFVISMPSHFLEANRVQILKNLE